MKENTEYVIGELSINDIEDIKALFLSVFTIEPWNDDWSDENQLNLYMIDLVNQTNSLTYGIFEDAELIGVSLGHIKHWYTGTEYCIDEFCVKTNRQGTGIGKLFMEKIQLLIKERGLSQIFLQTDRDVPAYQFYKKMGFYELESHVSFGKQV